VLQLAQASKAGQQSLRALALKSYGHFLVINCQLTFDHDALPEEAMVYPVAGAELLLAIVFVVRLVCPPPYPAWLGRLAGPGAPTPPIDWRLAAITPSTLTPVSCAGRAAGPVRHGFGRLARR
jgi:hypothetical protein